MRFFAFFVLVSILSCEGGLAYTPPPGIPDPGTWGDTHPIDSSAPDTSTACPGWPDTAVSNCYYIDNSVACSDATNGYPSTPRCTIGNSYTAGSYIEVHGGPYTTEKTITFSGSSSAPIWFRGESSGNMPVISENMFVSGTYTIFENIEFTGFSGPAIKITGAASNNIAIRHIYVHDLTYPGSDTAVFPATPDQGGAIHDLVYYDIDFSDIGDWSSEEDNDYHGVNPTLWGRTPPTTIYNVWCLNNTAYHISGDLFQSNGDQRDAEKGRTIEETNLSNCKLMYVGGNTISYSRQALATPKFTTTAIISKNTAHNCYNVPSDSGYGGVNQEGSRDVWWLFNTFHDLTYGLKQSNTSFTGAADANLTSYMVGNVIYNIDDRYNMSTGYTRNSAFKPAQAINFQRAYYKRYVIDNTIYNVGGGVNIGNQVEGDETIMSGNVIAGVVGVDDAANNDFHISLLSSDGTTTVDYSYFQPRSDSSLVTFYWSGFLPLITTSLSSFQTLTGECQHCDIGDPLFTSASASNFIPTRDSPLVGSSVKHNVYDIFYNNFGRSIAVDATGKQRPSGGGWSIGAFEPKGGRFRLPGGSLAKPPPPEAP